MGLIQCNAGTGRRRYHHSRERWGEAERTESASDRAQKYTCAARKENESRKRMKERVGERAQIGERRIPMTAMEKVLAKVELTMAYPRVEAAVKTKENWLPSTVVAKVGARLPPNERAESDGRNTAEES